MPRRESHPAAQCFLFLLCCLALFGCQSDTTPADQPAPERVSVAVTSYPLLVMAETLAGDAADVTLVIDGEQSSPDWKPTNEAVRTMQQATRILLSGGDYEPWKQRVTLPRSRVIDTARGHYDRFIRIPDATVHQHGPEGAHSHPGVVWATWLDPQLAMSHLETTSSVLQEVLPQHVAEIRAAADQLTTEWQKPDQQLQQLADSTAEAPLTVLGDAPVYQYLAQRLGWKLHYVHLPAQGPLSEDDRQSLAKAIGEHQPNLVLIRSTLADEIPALQGDSTVPFVSIDLCEHSVDGRSLTERLQQNLDALAGGVAGP